MERNFTFSFWVYYLDENLQPTGPDVLKNAYNQQDLQNWYSISEEDTQFHFRAGCQLVHTSYNFNQFEDAIGVGVVITYTDNSGVEDLETIIDNELLVAQMFSDPDDGCNRPLDGLCIHGVLDMNNVRYSVE
jgi:hypothetical protein